VGGVPGLLPAGPGGLCGGIPLRSDAIYASLRPQAGLTQGVPVTWATLTDGSQALLHMSLDNRKRYQDGLEQWRDLVRRGLPTPLTVTTDGAPRLPMAVEAMGPGGRI